MSNRTPYLVAAGIICLLALAIGGFWLAAMRRQPRGTPEEQLLRMLVQGEAAAERRDVAALNRMISENYLDSAGMNSARLRFQIGRWLRGQRELDVVIPSGRVRTYVAPDGRTGELTFPIELRWTSPDAPGRASMELSLTLQREKVHYYLVFPGEEWRIVSASGYIPLD